MIGRELNTPLNARNLTDQTRLITRAPESDIAR